MTPTTLPEDWQPTPGDIRYAESKGFCKAQIAEIAESFRAYWLNGPGCRKKWKEWHGGNGAWGTWIRRETPWPAWKREQAEPQKEWYESSLSSPDVKQYPPLKPRIRRMPGPATPLGPEGRRAIMDKIKADEPKRPPRAKIGPRRVPMPDHLREKLIERILEKANDQP